MKPSISTCVFTGLLLINPALSGKPVDPPFPFQVVPSNAVPPGFKIMKDGGSGESLALYDPNLPGLQILVVGPAVDKNWELVIPENAADYGYTTEMVKQPKELRYFSSDPNSAAQDQRILQNAEPGEIMVRRNRLKPGVGIVPAPLGPDQHYLVPKILPRGVTIKSEIPTQRLPPPLQLQPAKARLRQGMQPLNNNPPSGKYSVLYDPSNPKLLIMLPTTPKSMKIIKPLETSRGIRIIYKNFPGGFASYSTTPFGMTKLPVPGLGEKLVMSDSSVPEEMTIIPRPLPGMKWAAKEQSNIQWNVMKNSDIEGYSSQEDTEVPYIQDDTFDENSAGTADLFPANFQENAAAQGPYNTGVGENKQADSGYEQVMGSVDGNFAQGGYQGGVGQDYQNADNSNAEQLSNNVYVDQNQGYFARPNEYAPQSQYDELPQEQQPQLPQAEEEILEVMNENSATAPQNWIFGGYNQKLKLFLSCILYAILI